MRDIKFRAWNPHDKELCEVYTISKTYVNYITDIPEKESMCRVPIDEIILMQYTGLKDKNGIEIYEEDIVKDGSGFLYQIVWRKKKARFAYKCKLGSKTNMNQKQDIADGIEVIGNIYENSDLLKC